MENRVTIRLTDADMERLSEAAAGADLPISTYARSALISALDQSLILRMLKRQEKIQLEMFRRIVVDFQMVHVKKTLEETKPISVEITKKFLESLDAEE